MITGPDAERHSHRVQSLGENNVLYSARLFRFAQLIAKTDLSAKSR